MGFSIREILNPIPSHRLKKAYPGPLFEAHSISAARTIGSLSRRNVNIAQFVGVARVEESFIR
jgi:hypothetical protein